MKPRHTKPAKQATKSTAKFAAQPRDLYSFREGWHRLQCSERKFMELVDAKAFQLVDIRTPGAKRPTWRITRKSFERFIESRKVAAMPKGNGEWRRNLQNAHN